MLFNDFAYTIYGYLYMYYLDHVDGAREDHWAALLLALRVVVEEICHQHRADHLREDHEDADEPSVAVLGKLVVRERPEEELEHAAEPEGEHVVCGVLRDRATRLVEHEQLGHHREHVHVQRESPRHITPPRVVQRRVDKDREKERGGGDPCGAKLGAVATGRADVAESVLLDFVRVAVLLVGKVQRGARCRERGELSEPVNEVAGAVKRQVSLAEEGGEEAEEEGGRVELDSLHRDTADRFSARKLDAEHHHTERLRQRRQCHQEGEVAIREQMVGAEHKDGQAHP